MNCTSPILLAWTVLLSATNARAQSPFIDFDRSAPSIDRSQWDYSQWRAELSRSQGRWEPRHDNLWSTAMSHPSPAVRREAVTGMGSSRIIEVIPLLMDIARDRSEHPWVRGAAHHALLRHLTPLHPHVTSSDIKAAVVNPAEFTDLSLVSPARAASLVKHIQALMLVRDVMTSFNSESSDEKLRSLSNFNAFITLGQGSFLIEAADSALDLLARDSDERVRVMAAKTFYNLFYDPRGSEAGINEYLNRLEVIEAIEKGIQDRNVGVQLAFAEMFQHFAQILTVGSDAPEAIRIKRLNALADSYFDVMLLGLASQELDVRSLMVNGFREFKELLPGRFESKELIAALQKAASAERDVYLREDITGLIPVTNRLHPTP